MYETLTLDIDKRGIAWLTLNRPDVHNAFNAVLISELHKAIADLGRNKTVRVIVLMGAGVNFSAGADLNWMREAADYTKAQNHADAMALSDMLYALNHVAKPVIALVQGAAMGGGVGLTACADIAIAVRGAKFALSEVRLGLIPATIAPYVIAAMGERMARRYFQTGERFDGERARKMGFVHELVDSAEDLVGAAEKIIRHILAGGPDAVAEAKNLVFAVKDKDIDQALRENTAERIATRRASAEGKEGIQAFFDKRPASWLPAKDLGDD
jgi:methylglutaconyl-CoA hydratase